MAGYKGGYAVRECRACRTLLSWQWESVEQYEALYDADDTYAGIEQYGQGRESLLSRDAEYLLAADSRLRVLGALSYLVPRARILDVGAGTGAFVHAAERAGFRATGLEPSRSLVMAARSAGRTIHLGSWRDAPEYGSQDVITLHDVLEHMPYPQACLACLKSCLTAHGILVVEWPEWDGPHQRAEGMSWRHIKPREHLCLYSDEAARRLFDEAGLTVLAMLRPLRARIGKVAYYLEKAMR